jgi:hypothetical protein
LAPFITFATLTPFATSGSIFTGPGDRNVGILCVWGGVIVLHTTSFWGDSEPHRGLGTPPALTASLPGEHASGQTEPTPRVTAHTGRTAMRACQKEMTPFVGAPAASSMSRFYLEPLPSFPTVNSSHLWGSHVSKLNEAEI